MFDWLVSLLKTLRMLFVPKPKPVLVHVFINSKLYGGIYDGEQLPVNKWAWPRPKRKQ